MDFKSLFESFSKLKVVVLGDVMLDTYYFGNVDRISPEGPVPVVALKRKESRIGGAGNVALNTAVLGAQTRIVSVIGQDSDAIVLRELFEKASIRTDYLLSASDRPTTNKIRVISRGQQMIRLDREIMEDLNDALENKLLTSLEHLFIQDRPDILIMEDYNKGVLKNSVIEKAIALSKKYGIITSVDPKHKNFFSYKGVTLFKPNFKEAREGLDLSSDYPVSTESLFQIHKALQVRLNHEISLITLSEKGVYYAQNDQGDLLPSHERSIADVSGAGDTVIATASLVYALTHDIMLSSEIANIAGGLVCEMIGTACIDPARLKEECKNLVH